jgi:hypothetical protein
MLNQLTKPERLEKLEATYQVVEDDYWRLLDKADIGR